MNCPEAWPAAGLFLFSVYVLITFSGVSALSFRLVLRKKFLSG